MAWRGTTPAWGEWAHGRRVGPAPQQVVAHAPGRANILGEHTDHQRGLVMPFALARGITVTGVRTRRPHGGGAGAGHRGGGPLSARRGPGGAPRRLARLRARGAGGDGALGRPAPRDAPHRDRRPADGGGAVVVGGPRLGGRPRGARAGRGRGDGAVPARGRAAPRGVGVGGGADRAHGPARRAGEPRGPRPAGRHGDARHPRRPDRRGPLRGARHGAPQRGRRPLPGAHRRVRGGRPPAGAPATCTRRSPRTRAACRPRWRRACGTWCRRTRGCAPAPRRWSRATCPASAPSSTSPTGPCGTTSRCRRRRSRRRGRRRTGPARWAPGSWARASAAP